MNDNFPVDMHRLEVRTKFDGNVELYDMSGRHVEMTRDEAESVGVRLIRASDPVRRFH